MPPGSCRPGTVSSGCKPPCPWSSVKREQLPRQGGKCADIVAHACLSGSPHSSPRRGERNHWPWPPAPVRDQVCLGDILDALGLQHMLQRVACFNLFTLAPESIAMSSFEVSRHSYIRFSKETRVCLNAPELTK